METKVCKDCKSNKPRSDFYKAHYESRDGLLSYCKACFNKRQKKYRDRNRIKINSKQKEYYQKIKNEKPEQLLNHRKNYATHTNGMFRKLIKGAKARTNIKLSISKEDFHNWFLHQENKCFYCEINLSDYQELVKKTDYWMLNKTYSFGVDRKDSESDYCIDNIVLCCPLCNFLKGYIFTCEEFKMISIAYVMPFWSKLRN